MNVALVVPGPLDRRSGGYSYDVDLVEHLKSIGHQVKVWNLPQASAHEARAVLNQNLPTSDQDVVIFDALAHEKIVAQLENLRPKSPALWVGLVHHLAWLEDAGPRGAMVRKQRRDTAFLRPWTPFFLTAKTPGKRWRTLGEVGRRSNHRGSVGRL